MCNTDHIEMVELVNVVGQAAQGLHSGEARHESRRTHDHELPGAGRCAVDEAHYSVMSSSRVLDEECSTSLFSSSSDDRQ